MPMSRKLLYDLLSSVFWIAILVLTWIDARKTFGPVGSIGIFVAVLAVFGVLFALDRYLKKTESLSHPGLAVPAVVSLVVRHQ